MRRPADRKTATVANVAVYSRHAFPPTADRTDECARRCVEYSENELGASPRIYSDYGYSGHDLDRPDLRRLINDVCTGSIDVVVVDDLDRISRNTTDLASFVTNLQTRGIKVHSLRSADFTSCHGGGEAERAERLAAGKREARAKRARGVGIQASSTTEFDNERQSQ